MAKMEALEQDYRKVSKIVEFMMPLIENMDEDFKRQFFEKRKEQLKRIALPTAVPYNSEQVTE